MASKRITIDNAPPFRVVVADPPWSFSDSLPGPKRGASKHYATMPLPEIKAYLAAHLSPEERLLNGGCGARIADDSLLFLWRVAAMVPEAYAVVAAWGFTAKAEIVWKKPRFGMGRYVRNQHEACIIAARGSASALIKDHGVPSIFEAPLGRHSAKPAEFFALVERLASGPHLELFARERRQGWTTYGDELPSAAE